MSFAVVFLIELKEPICSRPAFVSIFAPHPLILGSARMK